MIKRTMNTIEFEEEVFHFPPSTFHLPVERTTP
jgi:hypothetical protein